MQRRGNINAAARNPEKERLISAAKSLRTTGQDALLAKATTFFKAAIGFGDQLEALSTILEDTNVGADVLRKACSVAAIEAVPTLIEFFEFLGQEKLSVGTAKLSRDSCYSIAFKTPGLMRALESSLFERTQPEKSVLAWFLVAVCISDLEARANESVVRIAQKLRAMEGSAAKAVTTLIFPHDGERALDPAAVANLEALRALDPQHDNDFPLDYRSIQIIPTANEINASNALPGTALVARSGPPDEAAILDRQFRLLREDMVAPIVAELHELKAEKATQNTKTVEQLKKRLYAGPALVDVVVDPFSASVSVLVPIPPHMQARLSKMNRKERVAFCSEGPGRRILARDSLLLFLDDNKAVKHTGRVVRNDSKDEFLRYEKFFCIGVEFSGEELPTILGMVRFGKLPDPYLDQQTPDTKKGDTKKDEMDEKNGKNGKTSKGAESPKYPPIVLQREDRFAAFVFQANSSVFSYEPILRCLQDMTSVPFQRELVQLQPPQPLLAPVQLSRRVRLALAEDPNQLEAVQSALSQRVSLIQGPPGTGKTYVGVQIVRALLDHTPPVEASFEKVRILCLCYTNHALDDFLLSLHEDGGISLQDIVRLGRSPKIHEKLQERMLSDRGDFNRLQKTKYAIAMQALKALEKKIEDAKSSFGKLSSNWNWRTASAFLEDESQYDTELSEIYQQLQGASRGGFQTARPDDLWNQWISGRGAQSGTGIWAMPLTMRRELVAGWQRQQAIFLYDQLAGHILDYNAQVEALQLLKTEPKVPAAAAAKVLGCTITSAAKNRDIIAQIRPNIVVVEEAGEILEASLLTCLGPSVKHLIMVGDHKQLRPKLECYELRKESGKGIDFDISLFERLATSSSFPIATLNEQRRMRPEVCDLIRLTTYPFLKDHTSVTNRDNIRGVSSNVIFIDHDQEEGADTENAMLGTSSKVNLHEVGMVREIVRYLMRQGYQPSDMVILTPYLGQLVLIQAELKKIKLDVDINDLDRQELQSADIDIGSDAVPASSEQARTKETVPQLNACVRVATVDNFQGEEAKIIVGSLVRCNDRGEIGFVAGAERINVLLSRSRDGLVLLGSAATLCNARRREGTADWPRIIEHLRQRGQVFPGFPAVCETHQAGPDRAIDTPGGFDEHTPCGGCIRKCNKPLPLCPLGHLCSNFCHPALDPVTRADVHRTMQCRVKVSEVCKNGHEVERECSATQASRCNITVSARCAAGLHSVQQQCYMTTPKNCFACKALAKKKEKEAEVLAQEAGKQQEEVARQREQLRTTKFELERVEQESQHLEDLNRLKIEDELVREKIANKKEPKPRRTKSAAEPAQASEPVPPPAKSFEAPAMEVPDDFNPEPYVPHTRTPRTRKTSPDSHSFPPEGRDTDTTNAKPAADEVPGRQSPNRSETDASPRSVPVPPKPPAPKPQVPLRKPTTPTGGASPTRPPEPRPTSTIPASSTSGSGKKNGNAVERLRAVLKHATAKEWLKVLQLPALSAAEESYEGRFALLGVDTVLLLANDQIQSSGGNMTSKIDALITKFEKLNGDCLPGAVDDAIVHAVHAVLKYGKFWFYARDPDLQHSAKSAAEALEFLVQLNRRHELFALLPPVWLDQAKRFQPSKVADAPAKIFTDANSAEARWDFYKNKFVREQAQLPAKDQKNPPATTPSESVDTLLKLTGLESVKQGIIDMYNRIAMSRLQGNAGTASSYNLRCDGNPGTGKTTVARLYASFLTEVGILPEDCEMKETSGSKLITDGVSGLTAILEGMKKNGGGVIFVDETYQLNPDTDRSGRQVLDFILPHAEKLEGEYGKIVWVFAGYAGKMDKLYEHNPGLPSRFPNKWVFEDYTDLELLSIMTSLMARGGQDVSAPPKKKKVLTPAVKPTKVPVNNYGGYSQPDTQDQWGNTWKWNSSGYTYEDAYNNITGTVHNLGSASNPLVSRTDNRAWLYNSQNKLWYPQNDPTKTQSWYPGSPPPAPVVPPARPFIADPKWVRVAITRLGRSRGKVGFGNARAVRCLFDKCRDRQVKRLSTLERENAAAFRSTDKMEFLRDDLLGPKADAVSLKSSCAAWKELEAMTGLDEVKQSLTQLVELAVINGDLEDAEMPLRGVALNRIFLGNPGTGKTTVASLYGRILCHLGLLSKGEVKLKNSSDFIGNVLGSSESQTRSILADSEGCVLVIDEAYSLNPSPGAKNGGGLSGSPEPYRTAVIDTIVEQVQGRPGEDRAVVMLGYRKEMENFLAAANPGLARRFQMENAFEFVDYTDEQLVQIMLKKCAAERLDIDVTTAMYGVSQLARARSMPNFGNAGAVDNLLSVAKTNMGARSHIIESDFHKAGVVPVHVDEATLFDDLVGCDRVLAKLKQIQSRIKLAQKKGQDITKVFEANHLFVGAPGTGKTTVARKMGQMFFSLGLLPTADVVEIKAADLSTGFVGQSAHKAAEVIRRAKGKVLFIDEAYQLNPTKGHSYMQEVVDTLVQELTSEELKGKLVVILAGYENEIDEMLQQANPGLRSRFSSRMVFDDFTPDLVDSIIRASLEDEQLTLSEDADGYVAYIATELCAIPEFGNGRDAKTLVQRIVDCYAERTVDLEEDDPEVEFEDLLGALESMQKTRANVGAKSSRGPAVISGAPMPQVQSQFALPPPPPVRATTAAKQIECRVEELDSSDSDDEQDYVQDISSGFSEASSNDFLAALQDVLDEEGLNNKTGVKKMTHMDLSDPFMVSLARRLATMLGLDTEGARALLREWQLNQEDVEDKMSEAEKEKATAKKEKRKALLPIWRCAVCGRADKPFIACYVSPYIVRYEECDI